MSRLFSAAFCSPAKALTFSGSLENPPAGKMAKIRTKVFSWETEKGGVGPLALKSQLGVDLTELGGNSEVRELDGPRLRGQHIGALRSSEITRLKKKKTNARPPILFRGG